MSFPPLFTSPLRDSGCDVTDYRTILPEFGTLGEFKKLVTRVHERNMSLIIDLPLNQTSDRHTGFQQSREHRDGPIGPTRSCSALRAARMLILLLGRRDRYGRQHPATPLRQLPHADAVDTGPERRVLGRDPGKLFLPVAQSLVYNYTQVNVESHLAQSSSLPHCVRKVIYVRKNHSTFGLGTLRVLMTDHEPVLAFTRE